MVRVRRLRHSDYMYINPDLIERIEGQHQSVLHMVNGVEYVVSETPEEIIDQIAASRVDELVAAGERLARTAPSAPAASVAAALVAHVGAADPVVDVERGEGSGGLDGDMRVAATDVTTTDVTTTDVTTTDVTTTDGDSLTLSSPHVASADAEHGLPSWTDEADS